MVAVHTPTLIKPQHTPHGSGKCKWRKTSGKVLPTQAKTADGVDTVNGVWRWRMERAGGVWKPFHDVDEVWRLYCFFKKREAGKLVLWRQLVLKAEWSGRARTTTKGSRAHAVFRNFHLNHLLHHLFNAFRIYERVCVCVCERGFGVVLFSLVSL